MTIKIDLESLPHNIRVRDATGSFAQEPRGRFSSQNGIVAAPVDTAGVSAIIKYAAANNIAVIPYGGGTGLVGGQVAQTECEHIVLSMHRMTNLRAIDTDNATLTVDAGMILSDVQAAAVSAGGLFPVSLAAEGSARIGGILATNAGGVNVLRYGNARDQCLGLEVVMADGEIWDGLSGLRKDNTGYDLRHLMIGSEGTLGIITGATLRIVSAPTQVGTIMLTVPTPTAAIQLLKLARATFGETISAFELIHKQSFDFLAETMPDIRLPFEQHPDWAVLMEIGNQAKSSLTDQIADFFEQALEDTLTDDAIMAQSEAQRTELWSVREHIPLANRAIGAISSHDISVPVSVIPDFIITAQKALSQLGPYRINCFGHIGDGNLHYNVFPEKGQCNSDYFHQRDLIKQTVHDIVHSFKGSVSAEHGVGRLKVKDLERYTSPAKLTAMRAIKAALDPQNILNPGVIVRQ